MGSHTELPQWLLAQGESSGHVLAPSLDFRVGGMALYIESAIAFTTFCPQAASSVLQVD